MNDFIAQKNSLGFKYRQERYILQELANFAVENFPEEKSLSKTLLLAFAVRKKNQSPKTLIIKVSAIRGFAKYLLSIGKDAYVIPSGFVRKDPQITPHIYRLSEVSDIWNSVDKMKCCQNNYIALPVIFRLLYCCGLRPHEVLNLKVEDVNLDNGQIFINESKGHISRNVVMPDDLTEFCRSYDKKISSVIPNRVWFLPNAQGNKWCHETLCALFRRIICELGIVSRGDRNPRMYDLRHTFATHRLYAWMREGKKINDMIPYLSAYMGHADAAATFYYVHLVPGLFENLSDKSFSDHQCLLPEVPDE